MKNLSSLPFPSKTQLPSIPLVATGLDPVSDQTNQYDGIEDSLLFKGSFLFIDFVLLCFEIEKILKSEHI